jgi:4-aminobutyrate aminotransferase-like enzyme
MKLAKKITGRCKIIAFNESYHGSTQGALSLMGSEYWKNAFRPLLPAVYHIDHNSIEQLSHIDHDTACVVLEPIQAERGVIAPSKEWMQSLKKRCEEMGAMLILDEIQTGFGRTGSLFAFEQVEIVPDILVLGKAIGGGMPLGAFVADREDMMAFTKDPILGHITTFGGHPVCCAAGLAALNVLLDERLLDGIEAKRKFMEQHLKHPLIKSFRSKGMLMAIEFDSFDQNKEIIDICIQRGVFTDWFLFASHCMRIAPPLVISMDELQFACDTILAACDEVLSKK